MLVVPDIFEASSVNSLRLCVGVIVSGELGTVLGGVEMFSGGAISELGLLRLRALGLWSPPGVSITLLSPPGLSKRGVFVSSPRAFLLLAWVLFVVVFLLPTDWSFCSCGWIMVDCTEIKLTRFKPGKSITDLQHYFGFLKISTKG